MATGRPLILIVDDDEKMRDAMLAVLESAGYEVIAERTATEALAHLQSGAVKPSLILLDLVMPGMSGVEFLTVLLQDRVLATIPVVFISGFPTTLDALQSAGRLGAAAVLAEPVDAHDLLTVIGRICRRSRPRTRTGPGSGLAAWPRWVTLRKNWSRRYALSERNPTTTTASSSWR